MPKMDFDQNFNRINITNTMALLERASKKSQERNLKECKKFFHQSYLIAEQDDYSFMSKLLELSYENVEALFFSLSVTNKQRLSNKRVSLKKKTSVIDVSFYNEAYEKDDAMVYLNSYSQGSTCQNQCKENDFQRGIECLRQVFYIKRDLKKVINEEKRITECVCIHLKSFNYFALVELFISFIDKPFFDNILQTLTESDKTKICETSLYSATYCAHDHKKDEVIQRSIKYSHLAIRILPHRANQNILLCKLYRKNNQTIEAIMTAKTFLQEIDSLQTEMLVQQFLCRIDLKQYQEALSELELIPSFEYSKELITIRALILLLCDELSIGMSEMSRTFEDEKVLLNICEQIHKEDLIYIIESVKMYKEENEKCEKPFKPILNTLLSSLAKFKAEDLYYEKLYCDCLYVTGEFEACEMMLIDLIQKYKDSTLPMVYLAMFRLSRGEYVTASEDFRMLYRLKGSRKLSEDLLTLHDSDRQEIARVHRAHAFRFLKHELAYQEASECFSVSICAIGYAATGLLLSRGLCYMQLENYALAIEDFTTCLFINPNIASALCARAVAYAITTHVEESIQDFRAAYSLEIASCHKCLIKLPIEHVLTFAQMLIQYVKQEVERVFLAKKQHYKTTIENMNFDPECLQFIEFLCQIFPRDIECLSTRIECLYVINELGAALYETNRSLVIFPNAQIFHALKAVILTHQKFFEEAINEFLKLPSIKEVSNTIFYIHRTMREQISEIILYKASKSTNLEINLELYNLAVFLDGNNIECFRGRMDCNFKRKELKGWLEDLNKVILLEPTCELYCIRANYFHMQNESILACQDYISALELNESHAINYVMTKSNIETIIDMLYAYATDKFDDPKDVIKICNFGLKLDSNSKALRALRDRAKSPSHKCLIQ